VLLFRNEDEILHPVLDLVDEGTRILQKFFDLHIVYKILQGKNFLSHLKDLVVKIYRLLENSRLHFNSPREFIAELNQTYPDLIMKICGDYLIDKITGFFDDTPKPDIKKIISKPNIENITKPSINNVKKKFGF
jgi:hypothetical protein